jgi:hypothetical protein
MSEDRQVTESIPQAATFRELEELLSSLLDNGKKWDQELFDIVIKQKIVQGVVKGCARSFCYRDPSRCLTPADWCDSILNDVWVKLGTFKFPPPYAFELAFRGFVINVCRQFYRSFVERRGDKYGVRTDTETVVRAERGVKWVLAEHKAEEMEHLFREAAFKLEGKKRLIIRLYLSTEERMNQRQIAEQFGVSPGYVSRVIKEFEEIVAGDLTECLETIQ